MNHRFNLLFCFFLLIGSHILAQTDAIPPGGSPTPTENSGGGMSKAEKIAALKAKQKNDTTAATPEKSEYEMALASFKKGFDLEEARDYDGALAQYDTAIITDPNLIEAYIGRGGIKFQKIDFPSAMEDYNTAIEISEKMIEMHDYRSNIKTVLADFEGAKVEKAKVQGLKNQLSDAYFRRGHLKRFMDDLGGGCEDLRMAKDLGNTRAKTDFQDLCQ